MPRNAKISDDPHPDKIRTPDLDGNKPTNRLRNVWQAWHMCDDLDENDSKRQKKRMRIFKAYNRFPPSDYSTLFELESDWQSNVPFGMLSYVVDNSMSSFYDMVTERPLAADIRTRHGSDRERVEWSELISIGFDMVLQNWDNFLLNIEQDLLDMHLYGKGVQMKEDEEGFTTEHVPADTLLIPDGMKMDFSNFDMMAVKRPYGLHELYEKVEFGDAEGRGWDKKAVLTAIRFQREEWHHYKNNEDWAHDIAEGNISFGANIKETVNCYVLYIKEFGKEGKISKYILLEDYAPFLVNEKRKKNKGIIENDDDLLERVLKREGFLYARTDYTPKITKITSIFMDNAGSGMWHNVPSLAEKIFVQCRQYDFSMNAIMDAVKINMSLLLQATTADASEKIKALVFGPHTIIPSDIAFVQQRIQLPTTEATQAVQFMMLDMFKGIGEYRINEQRQGGAPQTATQRQLDAAEAAKLSGTQLKRYNNQHTLYYRKLFEDMVSLNSGEKDYELFKIFKDYMRANKVPKEAYDMKNIESIKSNMLAGAGSPSFKLMAAEKTIGLTNISPKDQGQANAVADGLAALHGRANVARYMPNMVQPDKNWNERLAGYENILLGQPLMNPRDVQVNPEDEDVYHLKVHFDDMERTIVLVNEKMKQGQMNEALGVAASQKLLNQGGHVMAHIEKLKRDEGKKAMVKAAVGRLNQIKTSADQLAKQMQQAQQQKQQGGSEEQAKQVELQHKIAMNQLDVAHTEQKNNMELAARAAEHNQKLELAKNESANKIAMERASATSKAQTERKTAASKPKPSSK